MARKFYITTTLPYINADPHIGFALELVQADVVARLRRAQGEEVFFNTGTDEHGLKIYERAREEKKDPQAYADERAARFRELIAALNVSITHFTRTTDPRHIKAAQEFWKKCEQAGDIYKKDYQAKYCVGCELEKTDSELADGKCPLHPNLTIEFIEEENYFFRFSKYEKRLLEIYQKNPDFVVPVSRFHEIEQFVKNGLRDFSISRLKEKLPWGVPVPGDESQVMYVWFDALVNYISVLGWPEDKDAVRVWWPVVQVAGKDNLRQQAAMWQAMLLSAGLEPSRQIFIHGFITNQGAKMSKSLGNTVDPFELIKKHGTDAVRYFLLRGISAYEDGDFSEARFKEIYNADLANGLGNLVQRVTTLAEKAGLTDIEHATGHFEKDMARVKGEVGESLDRYEFHRAIESVWTLISAADKYVNETKVWEKEGKGQLEILANLASVILNIANLLHIFLPATAEEIFSRFGLAVEDIHSSKNNRFSIKKGEALFQRI